MFPLPNQHCRCCMCWQRQCRCGCSLFPEGPAGHRHAFGQRIGRRGQVQNEQVSSRGIDTTFVRELIIILSKSTSSSLPSFKMSFSARALGLLALSAAQLFNGAHAGVQSCPADSPVSCSSSSSKSSSGSCCLESPGGLLLQTQFWDTDPVTGPTDSWTIHGLW